MGVKPFDSYTRAADAHGVEECHAVFNILTSLTSTGTGANQNTPMSMGVSDRLRSVNDIWRSAAHAVG